MSQPRRPRKPADCPVNLEPLELMQFPVPDSAGFETKLEGSHYLWNLYDYALAKAYIDENASTLTLLCFDLTTTQTSLIKDYPATQVKLCDNTLCPDYFALLSAAGRFDIFGPRSTTLFKSTPPLPRNATLKEYQLLPDVRGITALSEEGDALWFIDLTAAHPVWKHKDMQDECLHHKFLNDDTVAMIFERYPGFVSEFYVGVSVAGKCERQLLIYQVDFQTFSLQEHPESQIPAPATTTDIYASRSQAYFVTQSGESSCCSDLSIWRMSRTQQGMIVSRCVEGIDRDFSRVDGTIYPPVISADNLVFYNDVQGQLVLYDPALDMHVETHLKQRGLIMFASPATFVMRDKMDHLMCFAYRINLQLMHAVKKTLEHEHRFPGVIADLVLDYGYTLFGPYGQYQSALQKAERQLAAEVKQADAALLDQLTSQPGLPVTHQAALTRFRQAVVDKNALDRFIFLAIEHPEKNRQTIYQQVMGEFPGVSQKTQLLLLEDPHEHMRDGKSILPRLF